VPLFRRESLHERLAREGGLVPPPRSGVQGWKDLVGVHGLARQRQWDAVVTATAPEVEGTEVEFVTLDDGSLLVEEEQGDAALEPLASAVEEQLAPPYRARGVRQTETLWAVSARMIQLARFEASGERIELAQTGEGRGLVVDGMPSFGSVPALEQLGEATGSAYAIQAERLDADLWEVRVAAL
jgi:hypothetical protein